MLKSSNHFFSNSLSFAMKRVWKKDYRRILQRGFETYKGTLMIKKYLSVVFMGLFVLNVNTTFIFAQNGTGDTLNAEKVKAEVQKRGTSDKKKVRVKMLNGSKIKGFISQIGEDSFTITYSKTGQQTVIAYRDVKNVEGSGMSGYLRAGIIAGAAAGATLLIIYIAFENAVRNN